MNAVQHWQWFVLLYMALVAIPVYLVHSFFKKRAYANRTFGNLILYFIAVLSAGYIMHSLCMWLYFTFFFQFRN
jgi:hypothetical protein